jgi:hypothetical protein
MATNGRNSKGNWDFGSIGMWVGQGLLAALFLFAGGFKLVAPAEMMSEGPASMRRWRSRDTTQARRRWR